MLLLLPTSLILAGICEDNWDCLYVLNLSFLLALELS